MIDSLLYDTEKARMMQPDGTYRRKPGNLNRINIQELFIENAKRMAVTSSGADRTMIDRILSFAKYPVKKMMGGLF